MIDVRIKGLIIILFVLITGACSQVGDDDLPTLVRFPTLEPTIPVIEAQSQRTLPASFTPTFTFTPSVTSTVIATASPETPVTATVTPSATITNTATITPTEPPTLSGDDRPIISVALTAAASTVLPPDFQVPYFGGPEITLIPQNTPTLAPGIPSPIPALPASGLPIASSCSTSPTGGFLTLYQGNPDIANQLGCASGSVQTVPAAWQDFQTGIMIWLNGEMLVFYTSSDSYQSLPDTFVEGTDPETSIEVAPQGLYTPIRGFLKIWNGNSLVRNGLGWASGIENGTTARVQTFGNGRMISVAGRSDILILIGGQSGSWLAFQGTY